MNILFIGDIVGAPGRKAVKKHLRPLVNDHMIDLVIANGENAAAGLGITENTARELFDYGVDIITMGNHTWSKSEIFDFIDDETRIIRPDNVSDNWPGKGYAVFKHNGVNVIIIDLMGRVGMGPANCPFDHADKMIKELKREYDTNCVIIDFHAEATSEKYALARYLDGRVSLICGTHTHVQTADECIFPQGTGFITDVGMTGPVNSVIGMDIKSSVRRFTSKLPVHYRVADGDSIFCAVIASIDSEKGISTSIERIRLN